MTEKTVGGVSLRNPALPKYGESMKFSYIEKAKNPEFWREVREKECYRIFREKYLERWEAECENTYPNTLRYSDWAEFFSSGKRIEFNYFQARQQLMAAAFLSLIYPEEEKYFKRLQDQLFVITNEYSWCIPAHYSRTAIEGNPKRKIDLFASETALTLSEIYSIFEDRLDDFIKRRVREELYERIVLAMQEVPEFGFEKMSNNWSAVCALGVGGTLMLMFPEEFPKNKARLDAATALYLTGYHEDGVCLEGASYWSYGFGSYTYYADMLREFSGEDLFAIPKVKNIATFMQKTFISGSSCCVSFSDGGRTASFNVGLLHYLKKRFPEDVCVLRSEFKSGRDGCARFTPALREVVWFDEELYENPEDGTADFTFFGDGAQWYIRRQPAYGFAVKGGCNREPHNHLDVGSFIFAKSGKQVLYDLGPGAYTKQYFSGERYNTFQAHSRSHSVPIIGEDFQKVGAEYKAVGMTTTPTSVTLDIAGAYGVSSLRSLIRTFDVSDSALTLTDEYDYAGEGEITERFVTMDEPRVYDGYIEIDDARLTYSTEVAMPEINTETLSSGAVCYMIDFKLPKGTQRFTISVK